MFHILEAHRELLIKCSLSKIKLCRKKRDEKFLHPLTHILIALLLSTFVFIAKASFFAVPYYFGFALCRMEDGNGCQKVFKTLWHTLPFLLVLAFFQIVFPTHRNIALVLWNTKNQRGGSSHFSTANFAFINRYLLCQGISSNGLYGIFPKHFPLSVYPKSYPLCFLMLFIWYRSLPGQLKGFVTGLKLRGIDAAGLSFKRLQVYKQLSITALAELIRSSETAAIALELRGFRSEGKPSKLHRQTFSYRDLLCLLFFSVLVIIVTRI